MKTVLARKGDPPDSKDKINGDVLQFRFADGKLSIDDPLVMSLNSAARDGAPADDRYVAGLARARDGSLFLTDEKSDMIYRLPPGFGSTSCGCIEGSLRPNALGTVARRDGSRGFQLGRSVRVSVRRQGSSGEVASARRASSQRIFYTPMTAACSWLTPVQTASVSSKAARSVRP